MLRTKAIPHNIMANFAGRIWVTLISLAVIPVFIKLLGVEAYGLIGIFISLTALLAILDLGLSSTLSRELARLSASNGSHQESGDLTRTLEVIYWLMGGLIGIGVVILAPFIAGSWVNPQEISHDIVKTSVVLMGLTLAIQWPASLYTGGLIGLQYQVLLNGVRAFIAVLQYGGAVIVLLFVSKTLLAFFYWQLFVGLLNTLVLAICLWRNLPGKIQTVEFRWELLRKNWRFAAGVTGISALTTILTQLDKIILSKMLSLEFFGYYALAFSIANILNQLSAPISTVFFPAFSKIVSSGNMNELSALYHKSCQFMALCILPAAATLALFSEEILTLWLKNPATVSHTHAILSLLIIGTAINALVTMPYVLQLAFGMTRLIFLQNSFSIIVFIPLMIGMINLYGALGAAIIWIFINALYLVTLIPAMHRHILKGEMKTWYMVDLILPVLVVFIFNFCLRMTVPHGLPWPQNFILVTLAFLFGSILLVYALPVSRDKIGSLISRIKPYGLRS